MKHRRLFVWSGLFVALLIVLGIGMRPQPILVEASVIKRSPMEVVIQDEGITRVKDRYIVSAPVSGFIRRIEWKVGDVIEQKVLLTELEPLRSAVLDPRSRAEAEARVAAARSAVLSAEEQVAAIKSDADFASSELLRKEQLSVSNVISQEELAATRAADQRAKAMLRSAKFAADVARYELDAASTLLKYSAAQESKGVLKERVAIRAPVSGSVLKVDRKSEGVVNAGTPLIELGDPTALEVAVDVLSFDAVKIKPGTKVILDRWGGAELTGVVKLVEPIGFTEVSALGVEEQRVLVIVDITTDHRDWDSLGDGYHVEASFVIWENDDVLQVPNASLFRQQSGWAIYTVEDGKAQIKNVDIGERNGLMAQILSGVKEGDIVIQHPDNNLEDGARILLR